jgi:hypothetical protein
VKITEHIQSPRNNNLFQIADTEKLEIYYFNILGVDGEEFLVEPTPQIEIMGELIIKGRSTVEKATKDERWDRSKHRSNYGKINFKCWSKIIELICNHNFYTMKTKIMEN